MLNIKYNKTKIKEPIVSITKALTEVKSLEKSLDLLPIDKIIQKGDKVIITPNWVKDKSAKEGVVVGTKTVQRLIQYVKKRAISNIHSYRVWRNRNNLCYDKCGV